MCNPLNIATSLLVVFACTSVAPGQTAFWLSRDSTSAAAPASPLEIKNELGSETDLYLWVQPETGKTLESFSLNVVSSSDTVLQFNSVAIENDADDGDSRFEFVFDSSNGLTVEEGFCDHIDVDFETLPLRAIWDIRGFSVDDVNAVGIAANDEASLLGTISVTGLMLGSADLFLQIGEIGMNHSGEYTGDMDVQFGDGKDSVLNAELNRCVSSETAEATVVVVEEIESLAGDFNGDGQLTAIDIDLLSSEKLSGRNTISFDLNNDLLVTDEDRRVWVEDLKGVEFGDADFDGVVAFTDFLRLSNSYGEAGGWAVGDFDGTGDVDFPDFLLLNDVYGGSVEALHAVPEPTSRFLPLSCCPILMAMRKRHRKQLRC